MVNVFKLENSPERSEAYHVPIYREQGFCHPGTKLFEFYEYRAEGPARSEASVRGTPVLVGSSGAVTV